MATADLYPLFTDVITGLELKPGTTLVVALGGGADSQSLLDLTDRYRTEHPEFKYLAIHLDHAFHPKSGAWAEFLAADCRRREFPAIVEPLTVSVANRESKEAQGREARYQRLRALCPQPSVLLLGQHQSDQLETFLLQLKRGAGPKGLSAMGAVGDFAPGIRLCRPLLGVTKSDIYAYAEAFGVDWIEDDTNTDTTIDRNFLRHDIIPLLKARWPAIEQTVARSAALCAEQQQVLDELLREQVQERQQTDGFSLEGWTKLTVPVQKQLLRAWLSHLEVPLPSAAIMDELIAQLGRLPQGKVGVRWANLEVIRTKRFLQVRRTD
ncbi:MAG: tRNA lysidine(34) synthetase TilS [Idiomarina sp.]|nr:tRNA lysidine(34) synthetase TilS [Idiomarina sp.]